MKSIHILLLIFIIFSISPVSATWWDTNYPIAINFQVSNGTRPYEMSFNLTNQSGTNNLTHIFCNGNCSPNFNDSRFTLENATLLNYTIERNISDPTWVKVWVNLTGNGSFQMYHKNSTAPIFENGTRTFIKYENFDGNPISGSWTVVGSPTVSTTYGYIGNGMLSSGDTNNYIYSTGYANLSGTIEFRFKRTAGDGYGGVSTAGLGTPRRLVGVNTVTYNSFVKIGTGGYSNFFAIDSAWHKGKVRMVTGNTVYTLNETVINTTDTPDVYDRLIFLSANAAGNIYFDEIFVHHAYPIESMITSVSGEYQQFPATKLKMYGTIIG